MGNWDRMKIYISDYLENSLDPTTKKEFEKVLESSPELRSQLTRVSALKSNLNNLPRYQCSDDFSLKLRERIHTSPQPAISRQNLLRYSFAASFIIVLAVFTLMLTNSSNVEESAPAMGTGSDYQMNQSNPVSNPVSSSKVNSFVKDDEMDVNTKSSLKASVDSTRSYVPGSDNKDNRRVKIVDQKK